MPHQATGADNPLAEQRVRQLREQQVLITQALNQAAQPHQPKELRWTKGQKVWLDAKNLALPYGSIKLAPRCHGPFEIMKVLSPVTYQLCLPPQWTIHPTFHTSLLMPYIETNQYGENYSRPPPKPPPDLIDNQEQYKVKAIRDHQRRGKKWSLQYLIKWKGYPESDNTWEPVKHVQAPKIVRQYHQHHPLEHIRQAHLCVPHCPTWLPVPPLALPVTPTVTTHLTQVFLSPLHPSGTSHHPLGMNLHLQPYLSVSRPLSGSLETQCHAYIEHTCRLDMPLNGII
jgi:hypothetical protein